MMVGPSGSGKSSAWRVLLKALENIEGVEGVSHVIDPKVTKIIFIWKIKNSNMSAKIQ
jgi:dynein heavy chain 1